MPQPQGLLDYLLILYLGLGALYGLRAGLALAFTSLAGLLAAWAVAASLTGRVVAFANERWQVVDRLQEAMERAVTLPAGMSDTPLDAGALSALLERVRSLPIPESYRQVLAAELRRSAAVAVGQGMDTAAELVLHYLAVGVAGALAFLLLFAATRGLFFLAGRSLHAAMAIGPLSGVNRLLGGLFGVARNAALAALVLGLVAPALALDGLAWAGSAVERSAYAEILLQAFTMVSPWLFRAR